MVLQVFEYVLLLPENQISQKQLTFNQKEEGEQMSKHIDYFIFKKHDEELGEVFCATLEDGGVRFGWKNGPVIDLNENHFKTRPIIKTAYFIKSSLDEYSFDEVEDIVCEWMKGDT